MNTLDELDELMAQKALLGLDKQRQVEKVMTPEIKQALADIDAEFEPAERVLDEKIARLTALVKQEVLAAEKTLTGKYLQAVFVRGSATWNKNMLEGMLALIPELGKAKTPGSPSVTIRRKGGVAE